MRRLLFALCCSLGWLAAAEANEAAPKIELAETDTELVLIFESAPLHAFGIDVANGCFLIERPREMGFRPALEAGRKLAYDEARRTLRFEWEQSDGRRQLSWSGVDPTHWRKLRDFARAHVPAEVVIEEK